MKLRTFRAVGGGARLLRPPPKSATGNEHLLELKVNFFFHLKNWDSPEIINSHPFEKQRKKIMLIPRDGVEPPT